MKKICNKCLLEKELETDFYKSQTSNCKSCMNATNRKYVLAHQAHVSETNRKSARKRLMQPEKDKPFSFYRDIIAKLNPESELWDILLSLKLTVKQRKLITISRAGTLTQMEISRVLKIVQPSVTKMWNGNGNVGENGKVHGGVYKRYKQWAIRNETREEK